MKSVLVALAVVAGLLGAPSAAHATEPIDPVIAQALAETPGGVVEDARNAYWPALDMRLTVPDPFARSVLMCPTSRVCAFSGYDTAGSMLSWGTCGVFSTTSIVTRSIADARATGYLQARNGTTVLATASAGNYANVSGTVTDIRCVP